MDAANELLFSNLPFDCSDELLKNWISARGHPVLSIKIIRDVISGTSPSFALVQLPSTTNLHETSRDMDGQLLQGRRLRVKPFTVPQNLRKAAGMGRQ
jgi:RNA recognition motif-containing protein